LALLQFKVHINNTQALFAIVAFVGHLNPLYHPYPKHHICLLPSDIFRLDTSVNYYSGVDSLNYQALKTL